MLKCCLTINHKHPYNYNFSSISQYPKFLLADTWLATKIYSVREISTGFVREFIQKRCVEWGGSREYLYQTSWNRNIQTNFKRKPNWQHPVLQCVMASIHKRAWVRHKTTPEDGWEGVWEVTLGKDMAEWAGRQVLFTPSQPRANWALVRPTLRDQEQAPDLP